MRHRPCFLGAWPAPLRFPELSDLEFGLFQDIPQYPLGIEPPKGALGPYNQAVPQHERHQELDVIRQDIVPATDRRQRLGGFIKRQAPARACAQGQLVVRPRGMNQPHDIAAQRVIDRDIPDAGA